jgi:hypothetical protein
MFSSFKERLNSTVKNLAESDRVQQASGAFARARTRGQQSQKQRSPSRDTYGQRAPSVETAERLLKYIEDADTVDTAEPTRASTQSDASGDTSSQQTSEVDASSTASGTDETVEQQQVATPETPPGSNGHSGLIRERQSSVTSTTSVNTNELPREIRAKLEKLQRYEASFPGK